jgi:hypothetical protein
MPLALLRLAQSKHEKPARDPQARSGRRLREGLLLRIRNPDANRFLFAQRLGFTPLFRLGHERQCSNNGTAVNEPLTVALLFLH